MIEWPAPHPEIENLHDHEAKEDISGDDFDSYVLPRVGTAIECVKKEAARTASFGETYVKREYMMRRHALMVQIWGDYLVCIEETS